MTTIEEALRQMTELPADLQQEVSDFIQFLAQRRRSKAGYRLRQDWAGAMKEYRDKYTAMELQKKTLEWRIEAALDDCSG